MFILSQSSVRTQLLPLQWVDLTGGMGVDFSFIAPLFQRSVYVERQLQLCEMARNNFLLLGLERSEVVCGDATDYLREMEPTDWIYLDPARRNENGGKTVLMSDCMPDVTQLLDTLLNKARCVLLKLSPMLDWQYAVSVLNREECIVREVHIVAVKNECKELLLVLSRSCFWQTDTPCEHRLSVICSNDSETFSYDFTEENKTLLSVFQDTLLPGMFVYEPYSSLMKAGAFALFSARFEVASIAAHSHLFVSQQLRHGVFGRKFQIKAISSLNKKIKTALQGINQANIAVRNFPMSVAELRKRLRLREGGAVYIFATTDTQNQKRLLICEKI